MKTEKLQTELIVEILDQAQTWGRSEYLKTAKLQEMDVRVLSLGEAIPPKDNSDETWLDIKEISDTVNEKIRNLYPRFLYNAVKDSGLLDITVLENKISLYWLMPISEMSVLRNPLIDKLYALFVLKEVLKKSTYHRILFVTDDELLEIPVREICRNFKVSFIEVKLIKPKKHSYYRNKFSLLTSWWRISVTAIFYWLIFNLFHIAKPKQNISADILGLTIFPTLWSKNNQGAFENLVFGDFPSELKKHNKDLKYLAIPTIKPRNLTMHIKFWKKITAENHIYFSYASVSLSELLSVCFRNVWGKQLLKKMKNLSSLNLQIDDIDIKPLLIRELQHEQWGQGILQSFVLAYASANIAKKVNKTSSAICAFEFQPIEKAFVAGLKKTDPNIKVIGLQTSLLGKSHIGYCFLPEQINLNNQLLPLYASLPDYIATYGKTTYHMLSKKIGNERVQLTGPIRYPYLNINTDADRIKSEKNIKNRFNLDGGTILALLALPSLKEEALTILDWAFAISQKYPQLYFLVRFHYWAILSDELRTASQLYSFTNYQVVESDLHELLLASQFMVTGTSSVGVEAMISGCMPISYKPTRRYDFGRIQDVEAGAFLYTNQAELQFAINECVLQSKNFFQKKIQWESNIQKLCTPLDGKASHRFYNWLIKHNIFDSQFKGNF